MSIRPQFVGRILDGSKRVEFRRRPLADDITTVVMYTTAPVMAVQGEFEIDRQVIGTPQELWDQFADCAGIDEDDFFAYYAGTDRAVGIAIERVNRYPEPVALHDVDPGGRPPQSVKYLAGV